MCVLRRRALLRTTTMILLISTAVQRFLTEPKQKKWFRH